MPSPTQLTNPANIDAIVSGDYNGDGAANIAIYRGISGLWAIRGITRSYIGTAGDIPVTR